MRDATAASVRVRGRSPAQPQDRRSKIHGRPATAAHNPTSSVRGQEARKIEPGGIVVGEAASVMGGRCLTNRARRSLACWRLRRRGGQRRWKPEVEGLGLAAAESISIRKASRQRPGRCEVSLPISYSGSAGQEAGYRGGRSRRRGKNGRGAGLVVAVDHGRQPYLSLIKSVASALQHWS